MNFIDSIKRRRKLNRAVRELSALSNETLRDIGIERGNIPQLVAQMMQEEAKAAPTVTTAGSVFSYRKPQPAG